MLGEALVEFVSRFLSAKAPLLRRKCIFISWKIVQAVLLVTSRVKFLNRIEMSKIHGFHYHRGYCSLRFNNLIYKIPSFSRRQPSILNVAVALTMAHYCFVILELIVN